MNVSTVHYRMYDGKTGIGLGEKVLAVEARTGRLALAKADAYLAKHLPGVRSELYALKPGYADAVIPPEATRKRRKAA